MQKFNPSDWLPCTPARLYLNRETGEVAIRAGFRNRYTGKIKTFEREATIEEIEAGRPLDQQKSPG